MKTPTVLLLVLGLGLGAFAGSARAQQTWRGVPQGQFRGGPPHGPAPAPAHRAPHAQGPLGRTPPPRPHVDGSARWIGHESGRRDFHYHLEHPWAHGHFRHPIGRGHVYRLGGWDAPRRRFWFEHSYFVVAEPDWAFVDDWDWNNDQLVLYNDPDHLGWYLAYNVRLGTYVHVEYDGPM